MRVHFLAEADFVRPTDDDEANRGGSDRTSQPTSRIRGYFHTRPVHVSATYEPQLLDFSAIVTELNNAVDQFTCHGSGYVMTRMTKLTVVMVPFNPLGSGGSSYIPTPRRIANKHAAVNVKIIPDDTCFKWAVLFPATQHADRRSKYISHKNDIDCSSLQFPVDPKQFSVFERDNPDIALHCLAHDKENKSFSILHLSPHKHLRSKLISLLLLDSPDGRHYVWVKNLMRLVMNHSQHRHHICMSCLQAFTMRRVLEQHEPNCLAHAPQ